MPPRPARERGRPALRAMAYQRAMADLRQHHREEFDELYAFHKERLKETSCQPTR